MAKRERSLCLSRETVEGAETMVTLARLGFGIIQGPRYHVARDIEEGRLVQILDAWRPSPMPISVLYPKTDNSTRAPRLHRLGRGRPSQPGMKAGWRDTT